MSREKRTLKRRDKKGRILQNGETHQKDGRYRYTYIDDDGKSYSSIHTIRGVLRPAFQMVKS